MSKQARGSGKAPSRHTGDGEVPFDVMRSQGIRSYLAARGGSVTIIIIQVNLR